MVTLGNFNPVLKEHYSNPVISRMLSKLKRNSRPRKRKLSTHLKIERRVRAGRPLTSISAFEE
jgi:hypothetical protein